ncbi:MAG: STN domain-containing protein, partial [Steroidobacteraceae bacterium]
MKTTTIHRLAGARRYQAIVPSLCLCGLLLLCTLSLTSRTAFASELDQPIQLDIPAHTPLDQALIQWGKRTGMQVMIATHTVAQLTTEGVKGTLSARAALESLLKGSGLTYSA